jgi:CheY-like chemotaxis protein
MEWRFRRNCMQRALGSIASLTKEFSHAAIQRNAVPVMMVLDRPVAPRVVLVVEDEMLLRMRAVDMVEDAGYTAVEAVDADQAFVILESRRDIALLFTDIQMPGSMDGLQLARAVHERWPPIKIILVSGQLKLSQSDIPGNSRFFGKPLASDEMIAEMRDMIGHT